ncbi:helix-turn-helix domain-containing protein [Pantoea agglomerans]|uniref:helix-turn-helix domain-containing protein n=1 Tax=Enterobacter agglomerans TaxID=549 RepID=UPI0024130885|nr:helix-turn-helix transcriptional regulator [Pantoea agglomerans]
MKYHIHPAVQIIRDEITRHELTYDEVARLAGIRPDRLRNVLSGRVTLTVEDRDIICRAQGISPEEIVLQCQDLEDHSGFHDIRPLPDPVQAALRTITDALMDHLTSSGRKK